MYPCIVAAALIIIPLVILAIHLGNKEVARMRKDDCATAFD